MIVTTSNELIYHSIPSILVNISFIPLSKFINISSKITLIKVSNNWSNKKMFKEYFGSHFKIVTLNQCNDFFISSAIKSCEAELWKPFKLW